MNEQMKDELAVYVAETMERLQVPGVAVGILDCGQEHAAAFGVTNVDNPLPVTTGTLFQIGSTSKTVTATAMMRLVEADQLDLEAPVRKYLPDFKLQSEEDAAKARVIDCVTHVGGWVGDYFNDTGRGDDALAKIVAKMQNSPQLTPVGKVWSYNNAGFYIAGRIVEVITGQPFEAAIRDVVLDPLGMRHSFFSHDDLVPFRVAAGHVVAEDGPMVTRPWRMACSAAPAGGIVSNVHDQLRYACFHLGDGTAEDGSRVLEGATLDRMKQQVALAGSMCDAVGISWLLRGVGGHRIVQHGGATNGQQSSFMMVPDREFALTVLTNADRGRELHSLVSTWILEHVAGISEAMPELRTAPPETLAEYAGHYQAALSGAELRISGTDLLLQVRPPQRPPLSDGSVVAPLPPQVRIPFYAEDRVIALDSPSAGAHGEFLRDASGAIEWFRWGGRIHRKLK